MSALVVDRRDRTSRPDQNIFRGEGELPDGEVQALLEAGVARAPDWFIGSGLKLAVAGIFGVIFVAYMVLAGRGKRGEHYVGRAS